MADRLEKSGSGDVMDKYTSFASMYPKTLSLEHLTDQFRREYTSIHAEEKYSVCRDTLDRGLSVFAYITLYKTFRDALLKHFGDKASDFEDASIGFNEMGDEEIRNVVEKVVPGHLRRAMDGVPEEMATKSINQYFVLINALPNVLVYGIFHEARKDAALQHFNGGVLREITGERTFEGGGVPVSEDCNKSIDNKPEAGKSEMN